MGFLFDKGCTLLSEVSIHSLRSVADIRERLGGPTTNEAGADVRITQQPTDSIGKFKVKTYCGTAGFPLPFEGAVL